jgi:hypothetical protein
LSPCSPPAFFRDSQATAEIFLNNFTDFVAFPEIWRMVVVSVEGVTSNAILDKGKPVVRRGRKAMGS